MSLRYAILGFLSMRPMSGYDIKRQFNESVRHFWSADQAAIYRTLADLETNALVAHERVEQQTRPDRKVYHITQEGITSFDAWLTLPAPPVVRREPLLLKLFFASRMSPGDVAGLLQAELSAVDAELAEFQTVVEFIEADMRVARDAEVAAAHKQLLVGPLITLTNGAHLGHAYRTWLHGLLHAQADGTLTAAALMVELRRQLDAE